MTPDMLTEDPQVVSHYGSRQMLRMRLAKMLDVSKERESEKTTKEVNTKVPHALKGWRMLGWRFCLSLSATQVSVLVTITTIEDV
jgi:hypothetical protein